MSPSVHVAVVSVDDMSATRLSDVHRFECVSHSDMVDGFAPALFVRFEALGLAIDALVCKAPTRGD